MSDHNDEYLAQLAQERADAAAAWDETEHKPHPRNMVGDDGLGDAIAEVTHGVDADVGPIEFEGKEDYIRGETACLRGCDIVGTVPQLGSKLGNKLRVQQQSAGFVESSVKGKKFLTLKVKPMASVARRTSHADSIAKARAVAAHARMIADSLKNFTVKGGGKRVVGDGADWNDLIGDPVWNELVGTFDDVLGAPAARLRAMHAHGKMLSVAEIRHLAAALGTAAARLDKGADSHEQRTNTAQAKLQKGVDAVRKSYGPAGKKGVNVVGDILGDLFLGDGGLDAGGEPIPADPNAPTDGSSPAPTDGSGLPPGPPDYGVGPAPTLDSTLDTDGYEVKWEAGRQYDVDPSPSGADWMTNFDSGGDPEKLPRGCLIYDKTLPFPRSGVGSKTRFFGGAPTNMGGGDSGFEFGNQTDAGHDDGWYAFEASAYYDHVAIDLRYKKDDSSDMRARAKASMDAGWGPLIGNPNQNSPADPGMQQRSVPLWVWGLKYDIGLDLFFWYWAEAPDWARAPFIAARLMKANLDRDAAIVAAKTAYVQAAAIAQQDAVAAAHQATQWATEQTKIANDQTRADAAAQVTQTQSDAATAAAQAQLDIQQQQAQQKLDEAAQQLDIQQQTAETQAYQTWLNSPAGQQSLQDGGGGDVGQPEAVPYDQAFDDLNQQSQEDGFAPPQMDASEAELQLNAARPDTGIEDL